MFTALAKVGVNIDCISTSEMKVSCVIGRDDLDQAVRAVHAEFFGTSRPATSRAAGTVRKSPAATAPRKVAATAKRAAKTSRVSR